MLQHTKRQVKLFKMYCFTMFITALCVIFDMEMLLTSLRHLFSLTNEFVSKRRLVLQIEKKVKLNPSILLPYALIISEILAIINCRQILWAEVWLKTVS